MIAINHVKGHLVAAARAATMTMAKETAVINTVKPNAAPIPPVEDATVMMAVAQTHEGIIAKG